MKVVLNQKNYFEIFGDDYDTSDGTAIRDFIFVQDIAEAHIIALKNLEKLSGEIVNLGSEKGFTVKEIIQAAQEITGEKIKINVMPRRAGDISVSIASCQKAQQLLNWQASPDSLKKIILTDWQWRKSHIFGYTK
jgi:UDP-glucose 4-epimerase